MKNLPKVFAKPIEKEMRNNEEIFYSRLKSQNEKKDILKEIDKIFGSKDFVYKSEVEITLKSGVIITTIVGKSGSNLLTLDNQKISIPDIMEIKKL